MNRNPMRRFSVAGIVFGLFVLVIGVLFFLVNQGIIPIRFDFWTACSILLIMLGILIIGGSIWAQRRYRGGLRRWAEDWDREQ